jgi:hypothetical protein
MASTVTVSGKVFRALKRGEWASEKFLLSNSTPFGNDKFSKDRKFLKTRLTITGANLTGAGGFDNDSAIAIDAILLREKNERTNIVSVDFNDYKNESITNLNHLANGNRFNPYFGPDKGIGRSVVVSPPISGKNYITMWRAGFPVGDMPDINNLTWTVPQWLNHGRSGGSPPTPGFSSIVVHDGGVTLDNNPASLFTTGVFDNHYDRVVAGAELVQGFDSIAETTTKRINVLSTGTTYSGPLLEVQASGNITIPGWPFGQRAIVLTDYQKPIIVPTGIEMIASCLIKTFNVTNNNPAKSTDQFLNGAGFTISEIDDTIVVGTGFGMGQVNETYMAGGLTGDNEWTYCSIRFTPTQRVVNFRLWVKDEAGEAWFSNLKLAAVDTMKDTVVNRQQQVNSLTTDFTRTPIEGLIENPKMFLYGTTSTFLERNPTNSTPYEKLGPGFPNQSGSHQVIISGEGWSDGASITNGSGFGSTYNASRDKTVVNPRLRVIDDFNRESHVLLFSSGSQGFKNMFSNCNVPYGQVADGNRLYGGWYYLDDNFGSAAPISGNVLFKMYSSGVQRGLNTVESLNASTEHGKWLYHENVANVLLETGAAAQKMFMFGIPQSIDDTTSGAAWMHNLFMQHISWAKTRYSTIFENSSWIPFDEQTDGCIVGDNAEKHDYYSFRELPVTRISSQGTERIGLKQAVNLGSDTDYKFNLIYKNQPYGIQNIVNKSEAFHDETDWGSFSTWTISGTISTGRIVDPLGDLNATSFSMNPGTGNFYIDGLIATPHNMSTTETGRQFVATIWHKHLGFSNSTSLTLENESDNEQAIYDSINLITGDNSWDQFTIVHTFTGGVTTLKYNVALDAAAPAYFAHLYGCHIYESDGSLTDGNYINAGFLKDYVRTSQLGVGYPEHVASGLYWQVLSSGDNEIRYLQSDLESYSTVESINMLPKTSGDVFNLDFDFKSDNKKNTTHYLVIGASGHVIPEASWLYNANIYNIADDIIDKDNPFSFSVRYRRPDNRRVVNESINNEIRTSSGLMMITSGGNLSSGKISFKDNWEFNTISLDESPGYLRKISTEFNSPDEYEYLIDNVKFGHIEKINKTTVGNQTLSPDARVSVYSQGGGISELDEIIDINESNLLSNVDLSWGKDNSFNSVLVFGSEYEMNRTPRHVLSVTQVDKKGRSTSLSYDEFFKMNMVQPGEQSEILFEGLLQARIASRKVDMRISRPISLIDYSSVFTDLQTFGMIYPTVDTHNPDRPTQHGDGILFKEGLKRFYSSRILNPDFVDTTSGAAARNWNYNNVSIANTVSYEQQKFGPSSFKNVLSGSDRYIYQTITWHPTSLGQVTFTAWFNAPAGAYAGISAFNTDTSVEITARKEGNGDWQKIKLPFHRRAALGPVDVNGNLLNSALADIGSIPNQWQLRLWSSATLPDGTSQGTGTIYYDGVNVVEGAPLFNVTDVLVGAAGLVIDWETDEEWDNRAEKDDNAFIFTRLLGWGMDGSHKSAARYLDRNSIDSLGFKKTQEFEVKFLSSLSKAVAIAQAKIRDNATDVLDVVVDTVPLFFLEPQDIIRLSDPNSGILNEYYIVLQIASSFDGSGAKSKLRLKRVG